jgi:magnesium-transporting ATPase (P-type)
LAEKLGIDIKIVTGDHLEVAKRVALKMGLIKEDEKVFSEQELKEMIESVFKQVVEEVSSEIKYKIVKALQKNIK